MKKYKIVVNVSQLQVMKDALEVFSRMHTGQWDMAFDEIYRMAGPGSPYEDYYKKMDHAFEVSVAQIKYAYSNRGTFYRLLYIMKEWLLGLSADAGWGVQNPNMENAANTAYDIQQVLRNKLGDDRVPHRFDVENELPAIEKIKEEE